MWYIYKRTVVMGKKRKNTLNQVRPNLYFILFWHRIWRFDTEESKKKTIVQ